MLYCYVCEDCPENSLRQVIQAIRYPKVLAYCMYCKMYMAVLGSVDLEA